MSTPQTPPDLKFGQAFQASNDSELGVRLIVTLLDLQDATRPIRRLRDWALDAARIHPGETVVDVGSGTGTMTRELAGLVGVGGSAIGVEPNPKLRAIAEQRTAGGAATATFVGAFADALPFADASVDLVWCERVLQHLTDAQAAVGEFARVLRPGGRALLLDSDHASRVTSDIDYGVEAKINNAFMAVTPNARAARHIPRQALAAGLRLDPDIGSAALILPNLPDDGPSILDVAARQAVAQGAITQAEADEATKRQRTAASAGYAFSAVTVFGFLLVKDELLTKD